jgi:hypothetical protein
MDLCLYLKYVALSFLLLLNGCALHYYNKETGVEHVWGGAHIRMKSAPPDDGVGAVVTGVETHGFSLGIGREASHLTAGWDNRRRIVIGSNAAVRIEWPNSSFYNVRVGTTPPFGTNFANLKSKNP